MLKSSLIKQEKPFTKEDPNALEKISDLSGIESGSISGEDDLPIVLTKQKSTAETVTFTPCMLPDENTQEQI